MDDQLQKVIVERVHLSTEVSVSVANEEHLSLLKEGVAAWNRWREQNLQTKPDLSGAKLIKEDLSRANLREADLRDADLTGADLRWANLHGANLREANFGGANLSWANLRETDLTGADLSWAMLAQADLTWANLHRANLRAADLSSAHLPGANLHAANLRETDLTGADLSRAMLSWAKLDRVHIERALLVETNLENATLAGCHIYGISAWNVKLNGATQKNLIVTPEYEPIVSVDHLEVAQFIHLLLNNQKIRDVIDTITSKVVLILGRFTEERKCVLDAIREELSKRDYIPVLFDFDKPTTKDLHETITTLARMSRFVIADITDAKSIPQELVSIVEQLPSLPVQPILQQDCEPWAMYDHIKRYPWVLELYRYATLDEFIPRLGEGVISPAEVKVMEIRKKG